MAVFGRSRQVVDLSQNHKGDTMDRRSFVQILGVGTFSALVPRHAFPRSSMQTGLEPARPGRLVTLHAEPEPIALDTRKTAVLVIDMQNDFGSKGGMFDRAGIDISGICKAVVPTSRVLSAGRQAG